jgi:hypothetical protein
MRRDGSRWPRVADTPPDEDQGDWHAVLKRHRDVPRKPIEIPPVAAKAFVKDMRAFHAVATGFERDEIAARQLHPLREHLPRGARLRLTDVHEMFQAMKDHA